MNLTAGGLATQACLMEVAAPKPGNVHRGADFADTTFYDFLTSAVLLGQTIDKNADQRLGHTVLECVQANKTWVGQNTNLGMILLLVPLAKAHRLGSVSQDSVRTILKELDADDSREVYKAIALASPGGLGKSKTMDVAADSPECLLAAMKAAEDHDWVARQYSRDFEDVFENVAPILVGLRKRKPAHEAIVVAHVQLMAEKPDSLISRKCGSDVAAKSQSLAQKCIDVVDSETAFLEQVSELDYWLRSDGNRRNPGTTADLIAAGLFVALAHGSFEI
jgi:triphosphoribosyl-dephospho-CoA synthase